ncbi:hypothetical protein KR059_006331, partial [Drosophila kikkawai]
DKRRERAETRRNYGNLVSSHNIIAMRQKQQALAEQAQAQAMKSPGSQLAGGTAASSHEENSLRRIASSFAHVCDLQSGCLDALPLEDSEQDAKEERAEVLICSQTMPMPMDIPNATLSTTVPDKQQLDLPLASEKDGKHDSETRLAKILPYTMQLESRATERWMRVSSTVSALFRARRNIGVEETPTAQTRRLREQRELLEAFTRPFLYEPTSRD